MCTTSLGIECVGRVCNGESGGERLGAWAQPGRRMLDMNRQAAHARSKADPLASPVGRLTSGLLAVAVALAALAVFASGAGAAPAPLGLGTAESFAVLA